MAILAIPNNWNKIVHATFTTLNAS